MAREHQVRRWTVIDDRSFIGQCDPFNRGTRPNKVSNQFRSGVREKIGRNAILAVARDDRLHKRLERESLWVWLVPDK